jgi:hypothetical protein
MPTFILRPWGRFGVLLKAAFLAVQQAAHVYAWLTASYKGTNTLVGGRGRGYG